MIVDAAAAQRIVDAIFAEQVGWWVELRGAVGRTGFYFTERGRRIADAAGIDPSDPALVREFLSWCASASAPAEIERLETAPDEGMGENLVVRCP